MIVHHEGRLEDLLELRARHQAAIANLGQTALSSRDLAALLNCAASLTAETLDVDFSQVLEARPDGTLVLRASMGWTTELIDAASALKVVIGPPEHPYGVLGVGTRSARTFSVDEVNFLEGIAGILAAAIVRRRGDEVREHLLARAMSAQEEERTRIARELHDETGQALSAILVGLRSINDAETLTKVRALAARLREVASKTIRDVGRIARGLRPSTLDDLGLLPALRRYAEDLSVTRVINISVEGEGVDRLPHEMETTLYRIIQEALTNVTRHADAQTVTVTIQRRNDTVRATIQDDGHGFDAPAALDTFGGERTLGLVGIQERASLLGGTVAIDSQPGAGACIVVDLPIERSP